MQLIIKKNKKTPKLSTLQIKKINNYISQYKSWILGKFKSITGPLVDTQHISPWTIPVRNAEQLTQIILNVESIVNCESLLQHNATFSAFETVHSSHDGLERTIIHGVVVLPRSVECLGVTTQGPPMKDEILSKRRQEQLAKHDQLVASTHLKNVLVKLDHFPR